MCLNSLCDCVFETVEYLAVNTTFQVGFTAMTKRPANADGFLPFKVCAAISSRIQDESS